MHEVELRVRHSLRRPEGDNPGRGLEACGIAIIFFLQEWPFMSNHTECVNNPSGAIRHQQFYSPSFSWALGIPAMCCLRIASGVVVGQPGQLGIVQLTIASLLVPIWCFSFLWKAWHSYRAALHSLPCILVCSHNSWSLLTALPSCSRWGWTEPRWGHL